MANNIKDIAFLAVKAAEDKKAEDVQLLEIKELTIIADYFVICSGKTERQVGSIAREIKDKLAEIKVFPQRTAGEDHARWILLDYADIIIHVFHHKERKHYEIERLWADARKLLNKSKKENM